MNFCLSQTITLAPHLNSNSSSNIWRQFFFPHDMTGPRDNMGVVDRFLTRLNNFSKLNESPNFFRYFTKIWEKQRLIPCQNGFLLTVISPVARDICVVMLTEKLKGLSHGF